MLTFFLNAGRMSDARKEILERLGATFGAQGRSVRVAVVRLRNAPSPKALDAWCQLRHANVAPLLGVFEHSWSQMRDSRRTHLVMPLANSGTLREMLDNEPAKCIVPQFQVCNTLMQCDTCTLTSRRTGVGVARHCQRPAVPAPESRRAARVDGARRRFASHKRQPNAAATRSALRVSTSSRVGQR